MSLKSTSNWILPKEKIDDGDIAGYVISKRGFDKEEFLNPFLDDIPSFKYMYDSKSAGKIIADAVKEGKRIVIHGDFDADGICAVSILWEFLYKEVSKKLSIDVNVLPYILAELSRGMV
jgi:single-stranded-DNA-specific exonuclease